MNIAIRDPLLLVLFCICSIRQHNLKWHNQVSNVLLDLWESFTSMIGNDVLFTKISDAYMFYCNLHWHMLCICIYICICYDLNFREGFSKGSELRIKLWSKMKLMHSKMTRYLKCNLHIHTHIVVLMDLLTLLTKQWTIFKSWIPYGLKELSVWMKYLSYGMSILKGFTVWHCCILIHKASTKSEW